MAIQHFDDPDRLRQRRETLEALAARDGNTARIVRAQFTRANEREHGIGSEVVGLPRNFIADPAQRRTEYLSGTENMHQHMAKLAELEDREQQARYHNARVSMEYRDQHQLSGSHTSGRTLRGRPWQPAPADFSTPPPVPPRRNDPIDWEGVGSGEQDY
jgi:hypothetical protein